MLTLLALHSLGRGPVQAVLGTDGDSGKALKRARRHGNPRSQWSPLAAAGRAGRYRALLQSPATAVWMEFTIGPLCRLRG